MLGVPGRCAVQAARASYQATQTWRAPLRFGLMRQGSASITSTGQASKQTSDGYILQTEAGVVKLQRSHETPDNLPKFEASWQTPDALPAQDVASTDPAELRGKKIPEHTEYILQTEAGKVKLQASLDTPDDRIKYQASWQTPDDLPAQDVDAVKAASNGLVKGQAWNAPEEYVIHTEAGKVKLQISLDTPDQLPKYQASWQTPDDLPTQDVASTGAGKGQALQNVPEEYVLQTEAGKVKLQASLDTPDDLLKYQASWQTADDLPAQDAATQKAVSTGPVEDQAFRGKKIPEHSEYVLHTEAGKVKLQASLDTPDDLPKYQASWQTPDDLPAQDAAKQNTTSVNK